jgi:Cu+-exporting ATPase
MHLQPIMLTGDTAAAAQPLADALGIRKVYAGLSPEQKLERIRELQQQGARVLMVGDGINDAAAIAQADSGIAMGTGTELAREAGDAILLHSDLGAIVAALKLARATRRVMKQNLGWAVGYNLLAIPLAAGALWAAFGILLSPAVASAAMAFSSLSVLLNSLRLRRWRPS